MSDTHLSASEAPLADDLLEGAAQIAAFLFGDAKQRRRVYWLAQNQSLPVFRIGQSICARPSTLRRWITEQEAAAGTPCLSGGRTEAASKSSATGGDQ
jgi:hypothetical protein